MRKDKKIKWNDIIEKMDINVTEEKEFSSSDDNVNDSVLEELISLKREIGELKSFKKFDTKAAWKKTKQKKKKTKSLTLSNFFKYAAILVLPLVVLTTVKYGSKSKIANNFVVAKAETFPILITENGEKIELNDQINSSFKEHVKLNSKKNVLVYSNFKSKVEKLVYNKVIVPKGGTFRLKLADGSLITLNSETEFKYPVNFAGSTREVFLKGEAYFDVAHNNEKPFILHAGDVDVSVLGTSFNVSAYDFEDVFTTLVEGSVKIKSNLENVLLKPGFCSVFSKENKKITTSQVDVNLYCLWKDGKIKFKSERLEDLLVKLKRWYSFDFKFENEKLKNYQFTGLFEKNQPIEDLFTKIEATTNIEFVINKNLITIKSL